VFNVGPAEIIVILLIALVVFGPKRLPEIGKTIGKGLREFRQATQDVKDELSFNLTDDEDDEEQPSTGTGTRTGTGENTSPDTVPSPTTPSAGGETPSPNREAGPAQLPSVPGEAVPGA
jgi:TatA/E family protein of Tat protein translocase